MRYSLWSALALPAALGTALIAGRPAEGGLIVDQHVDYTTGGNYTTSSGSTGVGESFRPTFSSISGVQVYLDVASASAPSTIRIDLFAGEGFGTVTNGVPSQVPIGSSQALVISSTMLRPYEFDFATPQALTPGATYTLRVTQVAGNGYGVYYYNNMGGTQASSPYPSGTFYRSSGAADPGSELVFAEGIATPEPPAVLSAASAILLGLVYTRRRRAARA